MLDWIWLKLKQGFLSCLQLVHPHLHKCCTQNKFSELLYNFFKFLEDKKKTTGRRAWTSKAISIELILRPREFHWMIGAISWRRLASVGDPFCRPRLWEPLCDLLAFNVDSSIGRFHTDLYGPGSVTTSGTLFHNGQLSHGGD